MSSRRDVVPDESAYASNKHSPPCVPWWYSGSGFLPVIRIAGVANDTIFHQTPEEAQHQPTSAAVSRPEDACPTAQDRFFIIGRKRSNRSSNISTRTRFSTPSGNVRYQIPRPGVSTILVFIKKSDPEVQTGRLGAGQ